MRIDAIIYALKQERDRLSKAITALAQVDGVKPRKRRTMSAEARARIGRAARARWRAWKAART